MEIDPSKLPHALPRRARRPGPEHAAEGHAGRHQPRDPHRPGALPRGATIPVGQTTIADRLRRAAGLARRRHPRLVHEPDHRAEQRHPGPRPGHPRAVEALGPTARPAAPDRRPAGRAPAGAGPDRPQPRRAEPGDQRQGRPAADGGAGRQRRRSARWPARTSRCASRSPGCRARSPPRAPRWLDLAGLANVLGPTATALMPTCPQAADDAARHADPVPAARRCCRCRRSRRSSTRCCRWPSSCRRSHADLKAAVPPLINSFKVLAYVDQRARLQPRRQEPRLPVLAGVVRPQRRLVHLHLRRQRPGVALAAADAPARR